MAVEKFANAFWTTLTAELSAAATTIAVAAAAPTALQGGQFRAVIGSEIVLVTSGQETTTWTVTRGIEGTTAAAHGARSWVAHILTAASLLGATGVFDVRAYGAFNETSVRAAIDACTAAGGGKVTMPPGALTITAPLVILDPRVSLIGAGAMATVLISNSATDTILYHPTEMSVWQAGKLAGFRIVGHDGANACGIHAGDLTGLAFDDVVVETFVGAGASGINLDNFGWWTERTQMLKVHLDRNKIGLRFSVSGGDPSFCYTRLLDLRVNCLDGQTGILLEDTADLRGGVVTALYNLAGVSTFMEVTDNAQTTDTIFNVTGEGGSAGSAVLRRTGYGVVTGFGTLKDTFDLPNSGVNMARLNSVVHTGASPSLVAVGPDTDIDLTLTPKGAGVVSVGAGLTAGGPVRVSMFKLIAVSSSGATDNHDFAGVVPLTGGSSGFTGFVAVSIVKRFSAAEHLHAFYAAGNHYGGGAWRPMPFYALHSVTTGPPWPEWGVASIALSWVNGDLRVAVTWGVAVPATTWFNLDVAVFGTMSEILP